MPLPAKCRKCSAVFDASHLFGGSAPLTFSGCTTTCRVPGCGGIADIRSGQYNMVDGVISAFRSPDMTREKVGAIRDIVAKAAAGEISADDAASQTDEISSTVSAVFRAAHNQGITFDRILAIIALLYAFWTGYSSEADVQAALAESRKQTEISQRMLEALEEMNGSGGSPSTKIERQPVSPAQNRHERRKASALERRRTASSPGPKPVGDR